MQNKILNGNILIRSIRLIRRLKSNYYRCPYDLVVCVNADKTSRRLGFVTAYLPVAIFCSGPLLEVQPFQ